MLQIFSYICLLDKNFGNPQLLGLPRLLGTFRPNGRSTKEQLEAVSFHISFTVPLLCDLGIDQFDLGFCQKSSISWVQTHPKRDFPYSNE